MNKNNEEDEIDLLDLFNVLISNLYILILASLTGLFLLYYVSSQFLDKKFVSSTGIYVLNSSEKDSDQITGTDLSTSSMLVNDYAELLKSRTVMNKVIAELDLRNKYSDMRDVTSDDISKMITIGSSDKNRVIQISVTDKNPTRAQDIANAVRRSGAQHIKDVMAIDAVNIVYEANLPEKPTSPNVVKNALIGALLAFIIAAAIIIVNYILDDTIKTMEDIENYLELPVLGTLPYDGQGKAGKLKKRRGGA